MRRIVFAAGVVACLSLSACQKAAEKAETAAENAAAATTEKKSLARQAPFYQGQEQVQSIQSATAVKASTGGLDLAAKVTTDGGGWTQVGFLPRIYAATPPDGIYEVDVVGQKPAAPGAAGPTPTEAKAGWDRYKDGRVKGVKFISKTNEVVVMVSG